jgi:hypothetical protein
VATSPDDRKVALEVLRHAQFVYGLSRYAKKQVLGAPSDVKALRERLEAMREAARGFSPALQKKLAIPRSDLDAIDSGTEAVWKAAKRATPKIIAKLGPLVRDEPEAGFLIAPVTKRRGRSASEEEIEAPAEKTRPEREQRPAKKVPAGLTGKELAGLQLAIQESVTADEAYFAWLRGNHSLPLAEWKKRRANAERARRAEERYIESLFKSRSVEKDPE